MTRPPILPPLRRTSRDAEAFARIEAATRAYCEAWCNEWSDLGAPVPPAMLLRSGPAYEATKRCMIEALMAADAVASPRRSWWTRLTAKYAASLPVLRAAADARGEGR